LKEVRHKERGKTYKLNSKSSSSAKRHVEPFAVGGDDILQKEAGEAVVFVSILSARTRFSSRHQVFIDPPA
jgi:hypothetical protein